VGPPGEENRAPGNRWVTHACDPQGFADGLGDVMWLSVDVTVAGLVLVALVMERAAAIPDEEEIVEVEAEEARA
jgi:hypothetical protein